MTLVFEERAYCFFRDVVEPTVADYLCHIDDVRRGCLACLCLSSMGAHAFHACSALAQAYQSEGKYRGALGKRNWAFLQVMAVANATKHVERKPNRLGYDDLGRRQIDMSNARCGWPMNGPAVMIEARPGELWLLSQLVEVSLLMWREELGLTDDDAKIRRADDNWVGTLRN